MVKCSSTRFNPQFYLLSRFKKWWGCRCRVLACLACTRPWVRSLAPHKTVMAAHSYKASLRAMWDTWDPISNQTNKNEHTIFTKILQGNHHAPRLVVQLYYTKSSFLLPHLRLNLGQLKGMWLKRWQPRLIKDLYCGMTCKQELCACEVHFWSWNDTL